MCIEKYNLNISFVSHAMKNYNKKEQKKVKILFWFHIFHKQLH
jgi:hypothetical protein